MVLIAVKSLPLCIVTFPTSFIYITVLAQKLFEFVTSNEFGRDLKIAAWQGGSW